MAVTLEDSGTQTATISTEHTLSTRTGSKCYQAIVDISALVAGEYVEIRIKSKALSGGTTRTVFSQTFSSRDGAIDPIIITEPFLSDLEYVATLKQTNGTGRAFPWKVVSP